MSSNVDSRVVQMQFDNKQFEQSISQTIESIENLNKRLEKSNQAKAFSRLTSTMQYTDISRIADAVDGISSRFSTLGIVGMEVIQRLTNAGIDMGKKIASAATVDIMSGGKQRAMNLEQSKFLLEGMLKDGSKVNEVMQNVSDALDGTAYGLDEGAKAAAVFAASNVNAGKEMENAIKSVAGASAMAGTDFMEIADIFSDITAMGKVTSHELDRFSVRGLAVAQDWANSMDITKEELDSKLKSGALEVNDFLDFMAKKYGEHAKDANQTFSGALANMHTALKRWGAMFYEPGIQFATDIINEVRESIKAMADESKPAVEVFKKMGGALTKNIVKGFDKLQEAGAFIKIGKGISNTLIVLMRYIKAIGTALGKAFPEASLQTIIIFTKKFLGFSEGLKKNSKNLDGFATSFERYMKPFHRLGSLLVDVGKGITNLVKNMKATGAFKNIIEGIFLSFESLLIIVNSVKEAFGEVFNIGEISSVIKQITGAFESLAEGIYGFVVNTGVFKNLFIGLFSIIKSGFNVFSKLGSMFGDIFKSFSGGDTIIEKVSSAFKTFAESLEKGTATITIFDKIGNGISTLSTKMRSAIDTLMGGESIFKKLARTLDDSGSLMFSIFGFIGNAIGGFITRVSEAIGSFDTLEKTLTSIGLIDIVLRAVGAFQEFTDKASLTKELMEKFKDTLSTFKDNFLEMPSSIKETLDAVTDSLTNTQEKLDSKALKRIAEAVLALAIALKLLSTLNVEELGTGLAGIAGVFTEMIIAITILLKVLEGKDAKSFTKNMKALVSISDAMIRFSIALLIMAKAVQMLSTLKPEELATGLIGLTVMLGATMGFVIGISRYSGKFDKAAMEAAKSMIVISAALLIMAQAVKQFGQMKPEELAKGLGSVIILMGAIFGFSVGISKLTDDDKKLTEVAGFMLALGAALNVLALAVKQFGQMKPEELAKGLGSVIILMGAIFGLSVGLEQLGGNGRGMIVAGIGMIAIAAAIRILTPAIRELGTLDMEQLSQGLESLAAALVMMALASQTTSLAGGAGILAMAIALSILANAIQTIGTMNIQQVAVGLGALLVVLGAFVGLGALMTIFEGLTIGLLLFGAAVTLVGVGVMALGAGLMLLGAGLTSLSAGILSTTAVTTTAIEAMTNIIKAGFQALIDLIPNVMISIAEGIVVFLERIAELAPRFVDAMTTIIHCLIEAIDNNVPDLIETGVNMILDLLHSISEHAQEFAEEGIDCVLNFLDGVESKIDDVIQKGYDLVISFIEGLANGIRENSGDVKDAIGELCSALFDAFIDFFKIGSPSKLMEEQGGYITDGLLNGLGGLSSTFSTYISSALSKGFNKVTGFAGRFKTSGANIVKGLAAGLKSRASSVASTIGPAVQKGFKSITGYVSRFRTAGGNLVSGVANGIRNGLSSVISATGSIASKALAKFKEKLKINSPSKVFMAAAESIPEGIAKGITKYSGMAYDSVEDMAGNLSTAMRTTVDKALELMDKDNTFRPVIAPVLNLDDVRKDASQIDSMIGTTSDLAYSIEGNSGNVFSQYQTANMLDRLTATLNGIKENANTRQFPINNYITIDGSTDPEVFADKLIRRMKIQARM